MRCTGGAVASPDVLPNKVIGEDQVSEEVSFTYLCEDPALTADAALQPKT